MIKQKLVKQFIVAPGSKVDLKKFTTDWAGKEEAKKVGSGDKVKTARTEDPGEEPGGARQSPGTHLRQ